MPLPAGDGPFYAGGPSTPSSPGAPGSPPPGTKTPGAPVPPDSNLIPGAAGYAQAEILANNAYNNALASLNQNRLNTLLGYGYTGTVDPKTGGINNVHVDPNAMYGELQQLLHNQAAENQQAMFASEDRGLRGGLAHQAQSELRYQHGAQDTQLGTTLASALSGLADQQQSASETRNNALADAENSAAGTAVSSQLGNDIQTLINTLGTPTGSSTSSSTPTGSPGPAPKGSAGKAGAAKQKAVARVSARQRAAASKHTAAARNRRRL